MNVIEEVRKLNLPLGKYVVVGSGIMAAKGLKETHDIDIMVTPDIFQKFRDEGWEVVPWTYDDHKGQVFLRRGIFELYLDVNCGNFWPTTEELINRAEIIDGIPFASLSDTVSFKKAYGREKHLRDVVAIENYLNNSNTRSNL